MKTTKNKLLLSCKDLCIGYENNTVLEGVSFDIFKGDYLCIVGENGAGKSTLVKCLVGLKKPMSGEIKFADNRLRSRIGYLPQQTSIQREFPASVSEVVISGCLNRHKIFPFYTAEDRETAEKYMKELGIIELSRRSYRELSGGQQQRVLLARALCASGGLLVLDEPVTGLDPIVSGEIYSILCEINSKYRTTVIMVSHDVNTAVKFAGKILHIKNNVQFFGSTDDYLKSDGGRSFIGGRTYA